MIRSKDKLLTIKQFAQICRTTERTIRFYDQKGLLKPIKVDNQTGYRYYTAEQARDFFRIKLLQTFDISLGEMKLSLRKSSQEEFIELELQKVTYQIEEMQKKYFFLKEIKNFVHNSENSEKFFQIQEVGPFLVFGTVKKHSRYDQINQILEELYNKAAELNIKTTDEHIVRYLQPETYRPHDVDLEISLICVSNHQYIQTPADYFIKKIPKKKSLVYVYKGPYIYSTFIHQKLYAGSIASKLVGFPFDWEIKNPQNTESEYDYVTKIVYPIE
jgi:DNA-binding transcriptional MerR regulator